MHNVKDNKYKIPDIRFATSGMKRQKQKMKSIILTGERLLQNKNRLGEKTKCNAAFVAVFPLKDEIATKFPSEIFRNDDRVECIRIE